MYCMNVSPWPEIYISVRPRMCILASREHTCVHPKVSLSRSKNDDCKRLLDYADVSPLSVTSYPGLPPRFVSQPWRNPLLFLHGCETKAGVGRTGNEATITRQYPFSSAGCLLLLLPPCAAEARLPGPAPAAGLHHGLGHRGPRTTGEEDQGELGREVRSLRACLWYGSVLSTCGALRCGTNLFKTHIRAQVN